MKGLLLRVQFDMGVERCCFDGECPTPVARSSKIQLCVNGTAKARATLTKSVKNTEANGPIGSAKDGLHVLGRLIIVHGNYCRYWRVFSDEFQARRNVKYAADEAVGGCHSRIVRCQSL